MENQVEKVIRLFQNFSPSALLNNQSEAMHKKLNLPTKSCQVCGRPFTWRKKWEKVWDEVKYCSDRCRANKNRTKIETIKNQG